MEDAINQFRTALLVSFLNTPANHQLQAPGRKAKVWTASLAKQSSVGSVLMTGINILFLFFSNLFSSTFKSRFLFPGLGMLALEF